MGKVKNIVIVVLVIVVLVLGGMLIYSNVNSNNDNDVSFLANKKWDVESLNEKIPYIQEEIEGTIYYAPIPKGFTVSTNANENKISEGLVIQDSEGNQFVWVPVNDSYKIVGDVNGDGTFHNWHELYYENYAITDIPYLDSNDMTALEYWNASSNGHKGKIERVIDEFIDSNIYSEPYTRAADWEVIEYQMMIDSVLKYGGFYVGRYETGVKNGTYDDTSQTWSKESKPVIKQGANVWNNIMWNSTNYNKSEPTEGTAAYIARNMYSKENKTYGVTSTLIYGIQWDTIMNWANCYNKIRTRDTYEKYEQWQNWIPAVAGAPYTTDTNMYDVEKNIYDLAGNVQEWSMESNDIEETFSGYPEALRGYRGGTGLSFGTVGERSYSTVNACRDELGFRITLYVN